MESLVANPVLPNGVSSPGGGYSTFDASSLAKHINDVLLVTANATQHELESPGSLFAKARLAETTTRLTRYATEPQTALYIQKDLVASDTPDGEEDKPCKSGQLLGLCIVC
jgi:dynein heavy chain 1